MLKTTEMGGVGDRGCEAEEEWGKIYSQKGLFSQVGGQQAFSKIQIVNILGFVGFLTASQMFNLHHGQPISKWTWF